MPRELPDFADAVLDLVERVPPGHVVSYGDIAAVLGSGPRQVARVMSTYGGAVPWHRVLRSDGTPAPRIAEEQMSRLWAEGVPMNGVRVDMRAARWDLDRSVESPPEAPAP